MIERKPHHKGFKRKSYDWKRPDKSRGFSRRLKAGKRTKAWEAARRALKLKYAQMGITSCELRYPGCKGDDWLSFAHGRKRRNLVGDELSTLTILCCTPCHDKIEFLLPDEMLRIVNDTIAARKEAV